MTELGCARPAVVSSICRDLARGTTRICWEPWNGQHLCNGLLVATDLIVRSIVIHCALRGWLLDKDCSDERCARGEEDAQSARTGRKWIRQDHWIVEANNEHRQNGQCKIGAGQ